MINPPKDLNEFKASVRGNLKAYTANYTSYIVSRNGRRVHGAWDYKLGKFIETSA